MQSSSRSIDRSAQRARVIDQPPELAYQGRNHSMVASHEGASPHRVDAVVIGAGFSGLYLVHLLRNKLGLSVAGIEAADGVGGVWWSNRYPGARTDSLYYIYCYSFSKEIADQWDWNERYSAQPQVQAYLDHVATTFDLHRSYRFSTRVDKAEFQEDSSTWLVTLSDGSTVESTYLVTAIGLLSAPHTPAFTGLDDFAGEWYHTARWPDRRVDFAGKRVAVIGTGSTGVQISPLIAEEAAELTVFQRTANYVVPIQNRDLFPGELDEIRADYDATFRRLRTHPFGMPFIASGRNALDVDADERRRVYEEAWQKGGFHFLFETFDDLAVDEAANETACEFIRSKIAVTVQDSATAELLTPRDHPYGSKRPPAGSGYYEMFNRPNVHLVDLSTTAITRVTENGLLVGDTEYECDVIVFATGFDASTGAFTRIDIRGRGGKSLAEAWAAGPVTYLGFGTSGFPNLLMSGGPLSPFANIPVCAEECADFIAEAISYMREHNIALIEPTVDSETAWVAQVNDIASQILASRGEAVNTWFAGANIDGKARAFNVYFGGVDDYIARCDSSAEKGYEGFVLTRA
jgi:cyclohexanone monooxygenase